MKSYLKHDHRGSTKCKFGEVCSYASSGAELKKPLVCARCKGAAYCSKECQVKGWKAGHKQACKGKVVMAKELMRASLYGQRKVITCHLINFTNMRLNPRGENGL